MKKIKTLGILLIMGCVFLLPNKVFAKANFDELLTNGKLVINGIEPTTEVEAFDRFGEYFYKLEAFDYEIAPASCDDTFTTCYLVYHLGREDQENQEIKIVYNYDKNVKKVVDNLISKMGDKKTFKLTDMEIINYFLYKNENSSLANFSLDFRKAIGYKNFELDVKAGDLHAFYKENIGIAQFIYNNTVYSYTDGMGVSADQVIYVDDNATDIKAAISKRIKDTFGNVNIEVLDGSTIDAFLESERNYAKEFYNKPENSNLHSTFATEEQYIENYMNSNYYNEDAAYHFITSNDILDDYYILKINGEEYNFAVIKDSTKIKNDIKYQTIDTESNVEINTSNTLIPLDTLIRVVKLTSGEEYDKIIKILNTNNIEMFDLKLFSKSTGDYITRLSDGTFEVRLPIKEELKDKNLVVYYVNDNNKVTEYEVTVENGYAKFNTNHFSIYTLGYKTESGQKQEIENPKTFDSIQINIIVSLVSAIGLIGISVYAFRKKQTN